MWNFFCKTLAKKIMQSMNGKMCLAFATINPILESLSWKSAKDSFEVTKPLWLNSSQLSQANISSQNF